MRIALIVSSLLMVTSPAGAGVSANPTRPTFSDNAHPMATGHLELELGGMFWEQDQIATPFLLKIGLSDFAEFKLGGNGLRYDGSGDGELGFDNLSLFTKLRFLPQRGMSPAMAVLIGVTLPTASDHFGATTNLSLLWVISGNFGPMGWDINLGIDMNGLDQDKVFYDLPVILALSANIAGPFGVILEAADYMPLSNQQNQLYALGAFTWTFTSRLIMDVAFITNLEGYPDWIVTFGFTSTLAKLW